MFSADDQERLAQNLGAIRQRIAAARASAGRSEAVELVAVSKYAGPDFARGLLAAGQRDLGENRVDHLLELAAALGAQGPAPRWHMIGHLQRNKARKLIKYVRLVQTVDSLRLAEEIQSAAAKGDRPVEVLIQVNVSGESQKHGIAPPAVRHLIDQVETMVNVQVRGLMCMAEHSDDVEVVRRDFTLCQELFEEISNRNNLGGRFNILSMGMSNDFETAIECGSNLVRIGSAVFKDEGRSPAGE